MTTIRARALRSLRRAVGTEQILEAIDAGEPRRTLVRQRGGVMTSANGTGSPTPGGIRGLWRSVRGLFGDPVVRDRLGQMADGLGAEVQVTAERVRAEAVAQGESTRTVVRDQADDLRNRIADVRGGVVEVGTRVGALHTPVTDVHTGLAEVRAKVNDLRPVVEHQAEAVRQTLDDRVQKLIQVVEFQAVVTRNVVAEHAHRSAAFDDFLCLYRLLADWRRESTGADRVRLRMETDKPVAYTSPDHTNPWGTKQDNHTNLKFTAKLVAWLGLDGMSLLDVGCSGGGFVKTLHDLGCLAAGVEGSDYSKLRGRAEWGTIPHRLFTADATAPFALRADGQDGPVRFRAVTAWEFLEHIRTDDLPAVFANFERHLAPGGVIVASVNPHDDNVNGVNLHQTVQPPAWWYAKVAELGFRHHPEAVAYFGDDWVRDQQNAAGSFYVVLTRAAEPLPHPDRLLAARPGA